MGPVGFLSYDGLLMTALRKIGSILIANFLFLLCCVPVFTAGDSLCALYRTIQVNLKRNESYPWRAFFSCFRQNAKKALPAGALLAVLAGLFLLDTVLLRAMAERGAAIGNIYVLVYILLCALLVYFIWLFAMMASFENTLRRYLANALLLMLRHLPASLAILLLAAVFAVIVYVLPVSVLICPTLALWLMSAPIEGVFDRYRPEIPEDGAAEEDASERKEE